MIEAAIFNLSSMQNPKEEFFISKFKISYYYFSYSKIHLLFRGKTIIILFFQLLLNLLNFN